MKVFFLAGLFASLFAANASAELVSTEFNGFRTVTNTETGVEWLSLAETKVMSFSDSATATQSGGVFEGWRLATETEVATMLENAVFVGWDVYFDNFYYRGYIQEHINFHTLFGEYESTITNTTSGIYRRDDGTLAYAGVYRNRSSFVHTFGMKYSYVIDENTIYGEWDKDVGAFMVRSGTPLNANYAYLHEGGKKATYDDVPAPFAFAFLSMAFLIPGLRRRVKPSPHL